MSPLLKDFIKLSLGTVFVYIIVTHGTGASRTLGALGQNGALIYKTLQGRGWVGRQVTLPPLDSTVDPIGMYAGNPRLPMFPRQQLVEQTMESLAGDPGIRLSGSTSRPDRYFGTDAVPAPRYPTGRMRANREIDLEVAQQKAEPPRGPGLSE